MVVQADVEQVTVTGEAGDVEEQCSPNTRQLTSPTSRRHELHKSTGSHQEEHQTNSTARQQKPHSSPAALHEGQQRN